MHLNHSSWSINQLLRFIDWVKVLKSHSTQNRSFLRRSSWLGMEKLSLTQQKHIFTNQKMSTTQNQMPVLCGMPTIHYSAWSPTIWPQYTKVTDRQTDRQWSDNVERTILQTVTQKSSDHQTRHDLYERGGESSGFSDESASPCPVISDICSKSPDNFHNDSFCYLHLHWLHHETTLLALFPWHSLFSHICHNVIPKQQLASVYK